MSTLIRIEDQNKKTNGFEMCIEKQKMKKLSSIILMDYQFPSQEFDMFSPYELSSKNCKRFNPFFK